MLPSLMFFICLAIHFEANSGHVVQSPSGLLSGWTGVSRDGREYWAYTKIPFAVPPLGKLRFKNPIPFGRWKGLLNATDEMPECVQDSDSGLIDRSTTVGTEDCLYVNVYVPKLNKTNLPVVFNAYGGRFCKGSIGPRDMADYFMDEDVVLVAMNYRVGPLGFMSLEDKVFPGNYGLKDQALALQWTKDNIASFGGNPDMITLVGVSAGAASTHHLMLSPLTRDLIKGAVSISGTVNKVWSLKPPGLMRNRTISAANVFGCDSTKDSRRLLACLQSVEAWKIHASRHFFPHDIAFAPTVEPDIAGALIPADPTTYRSKLPWLVSYTNGERLLKYNDLLDRGQNFIDNTMKATLNEFIGLTVEVKLDETKPNERRILNKIKAKYLQPELPDKAYQLGLLFEDVTFVYPAYDALERHSGTVYFARYECDILDDGFQIAIHGSESRLMFKLPPNPTPIRSIVSRHYLKYIVNFATYQNPTPDNSWISWTSNEMYRITCNGSFMGTPEDYAEKENAHGFWKGLFCDPTIKID